MRRILVVDDDRNATSALRTLLELDGFEVVALSSPQEALERLSGGRFDAVVTDLEMPAVHGVEVVRAARRSQPEARVVVVTAYGRSPQARAALEAGALQVLDKPLNYDSLLGLLGPA